MTVIYMNTDDIYQLFLNFNVPGVRKEAARLAKGVNMGDAGVMGELLQAAFDPSAGQQALQAGEAVQQPSLTADHLLAAIQTNNTSLTSAFGTAVGTAIKTNNAEMISAFGSVMKTNNTEIISAINAKMAESEADADAKMAQYKADADAKMAEYKADTDAKMTEIINVMTQNFASKIPTWPANASEL